MKGRRWEFPSCPIFHSFDGFYVKVKTHATSIFPSPHLLTSTKRERKKGEEEKRKPEYLCSCMGAQSPIGQEPEESRSQSNSVRGRGGSLINLGSSHAALPLRKPCHPVAMGGDWQS